MTLYQKADDVWVPAERPYVLRNGVWTACSQAFIKQSGSWVEAYLYDATPPDPPAISLYVTEDFDKNKQGEQVLKSRYINVGVRQTGTAHDPDLRLIRVLTTYEGEPPTTHQGGTYTSSPDSSFPEEPWSDWRFNDYGVHPDSSVYSYKQWPRNYGAGQIIPGDKRYDFAAWSLDRAGNWSVVARNHINIPKASVNMKPIIIKEAQFQPNYSGSWTSAGYVSGSLVQQKSPRSQGLWFYGNQITDTVGFNTSAGEDPPKIRSAQIYIKREDDTGAANANVYAFWTAYGTVSALPAAGSAITGSETGKLGTLAKGQGKWFDLPADWVNNYDSGIKGVGLQWKDPAKADAFPEDYSSIESHTVNLRVGEIKLVWEETL